MTAIDDKYLALGGPNGFLGSPADAGGELGTRDGHGRFRDFQGGTIMWSPASGAHEVHGRIRDKWAQLGGSSGFLGYPTTDESGTPDGHGRFNHFQGGSVYWTPQTDAHEVHGAIRDKWASVGWERSRLGYPLSDEMASGHARVSHFQGGTITWTPADGARIGVLIDNGTALNPVHE
jgi:uncharacterized protein with LGFP repeats